MKRLHHPFTIAAGIAISVAALWIAVRGIEWTQTLDAMRNADVEQLVLALLFLVAGISLRAERWRIVIPGHVPHRSAYRANSVGFFFNYVYPARAGDVLKVLSLHRATGQSLARLGASAVIDRLIDVLVLLAATTAVFWLAPELVLGKSMFYVGSVALIAAVVLVFSPAGEALLRRSHAYLDGHAERPTVATMRRFVERFLKFRDDLLAARRQWPLLTVSALVALADYLAVLFLLRTFGWQLPLLAPVAVWAIVSLGAALPSAPAGIGVHQLACIFALGIFKIPAADAFAFSLTFQAASFAAILLALVAGLAASAPGRPPRPR